MKATISERFYEKVDAGPGGGCHLWIAGRSRVGYGMFRVRGEQTRAHRFAWTLRNGPIPDGLCVLHRCDRPECVNPAHLFLGTQADNMADMAAKGRARGARGESNSRAKLSRTEVLEIRGLLGVGSSRAVAKRYGVDQKTVLDIKNGKTWRHL